MTWSRYGSDGYITPASWITWCRHALAIDSEQALLGMMLRSYNARKVASSLIQPSHFSFTVHRAIFNIILELWMSTRRGRRFSVDLVLGSLTDGTYDPAFLDEIGGTLYIEQLWTACAYSGEQRAITLATKIIDAAIYRGSARACDYCPYDENADLILPITEPVTPSVADAIGTLELGYPERIAEGLDALSYAEYLQTPVWIEMRDAARERAGYRCQLCASTGLLDVHHNNYPPRGTETALDLVVLCRDCHYRFHQERWPKQWAS